MSPANGRKPKPIAIGLNIHVPSVMAFTTKQKKCKYSDFSKPCFFSQRKIFKFYFFSLNVFFMFSEFIKQNVNLIYIRMRVRVSLRYLNLYSFRLSAGIYTWLWLDSTYCKNVYIVSDCIYYISFYSTFTINDGFYSHTKKHYNLYIILLYHL